MFVFLLGGAGRTKNAWVCMRVHTRPGLHENRGCAKEQVLGWVSAFSLIHQHWPESWEVLDNIAILYYYVFCVYFYDISFGIRFIYRLKTMVHLPPSLHMGWHIPRWVPVEVDVFDCEAGYANWPESWSVSKKAELVPSSELVVGRKWFVGSDFFHTKWRGNSHVHIKNWKKFDIWIQKH